MLIIYGCDLDKFTGYKHESEPLPVLAKIYGTVTNIFTDEPVNRAQILIDRQAAFSDSNGQYIFYYYWTDDNMRDKPLPIEIAATRFLTLDTSIIVYPQTRLDLRLIYGAPIIKRSALVDSICQVIVFDYQGAADLSTVTVNFFYRRAGERIPSLKIEKNLTQVQIDSFYYGFYQTTVDTFIDGYGGLINSYLIKVTDKELFSDSVSNAAVQDTLLLFPPFF